MNRMIKKIACAVMAFTLIAGVFTGCKTNKNSKSAQTVAMPSFTSVKDQSGNLAVQGTVGDMEYTLLTDEQMGCYNKDRGYYFDQLEQLDSPLFIVISAGTQTRTGGDLTITDFGMQGSTLVIIVEETKATGDKFKGLECPSAALELKGAPADIQVQIVSTEGEEFEQIKFA
ncbi:MAG: hypothetical protein IJL19_01030 [Clostridiales bacterium]|nr:hypothetical protein [Clostridiales bacterium]